MPKRYSYDLALPPRHVPWPVRSQALLGGFANQFGWAFLGFSLIFFWIFGLNADLSYFYFSLAELETAPGVIREVEPTNASENEVPIYANYYSFRVERLETAYEGVSYSSGHRVEPGQTITVEYLSRSPNLSRIQGMRRAMFSPWALCIVLPFVLVGLGFMGFGLRQGLKTDRLLADGKIGLGALKSKTATNTTVNDQTVYKLTFEFTTEDGRLCEVVCNTHLPDSLQDEAKERLLYDPRNPTYAVMLDSLPGSPDIDELGRIQAAGLAPGLLVLVLPALTLIGHGSVLLFLLL